ncbi:hypothetical protein PIB30_045173 [Stylosanthes scabra]|uniref:Uncharacterized protein n=1 Tax=Stylosanthes scabra TaxID=79078 RepID=A0ABU6YEW3_9FABA|nr:hypothetical protein [Stylosanthes scabra]
MEMACRSGRVSDSFTGGSSTASFEEIGFEDDLFSTYIDVEKLNDRGGVSNGSVHARNPDPHLHLLHRTLDLRNQAAENKKKKKRRGGNTNGEEGEEEEEVVVAAQVKVTRKKKKNCRIQDLRNQAAGEQEVEEEAQRR